MFNTCKVCVVIDKSKFQNNSGVQGGAIYMYHKVQLVL